MKKLLLIAALVVMGASAFAVEVRTNVSYFTFTAAMDTANIAGAKHRNDTLFTPWVYVGDVKRFRISVKRVPNPLSGYKDTTWASNANDTTKIHFQVAYSTGIPWRNVLGDTNKYPIVLIRCDSAFATNKANTDSVWNFSNAQNNIFMRDSTFLIPDYIRGMVIVHDSTKTTIVSSALVGNKYARQFIFYFNGVRYSKKEN